MYSKQIKHSKQWLNEAAKMIRQTDRQMLMIDQKSNRTDLVTTMDKQIQDFLIEKITAYYPGDRILAEENGYNSLDSFQGNVWIIDPIDGTLNFILEKENFCIMIAYYVDGVGKLGFIYDVMKDEMVWGGESMGVFLNETKLSQPEDVSLNKGLIGMNAYMYGENLYGSRAIGKASMGIRVSGCAGVEIIAMLKGAHIGYVSNLSPWDYAAGLVLLTEFEFVYSNITKQPLQFSTREYFLAATPKAFREIHSLIEKNGHTN